jgi:hypothetical protein
LTGGTKIEDVHMYYDVMNVKAVRYPYRIKLILEIPLKTAD